MYRYERSVYHLRDIRSTQVEGEPEVLIDLLTFEKRYPSQVYDGLRWILGEQRRWIERAFES